MTVDYDALDLGEKIGDGGEGSVYLVRNRPNEALKVYFQDVLAQSNPVLLGQLVAKAKTLIVEGEPITHWATWPTEIVTRSGTVIGFLMPLISSEFRLETGNLNGRDASFMYLAAPPAPMWGDVALPALRTRMTLLAQFSGIIQQLHHRGMVLGDISWSNVLWSPAPRVILLDCDGIRLPAGPPVHRQRDTPDWTDPYAPPGGIPNQATDCYKLALMVLRVLAQELTAVPKTSGHHHLIGLDPSTEQAIENLLSRASTPDNRPSATEWRTVLQGRNAQSVTRPVAPPRPPLSQRPPVVREWRDISSLGQRPVASQPGLVPPPAVDERDSSRPERLWRPLATGAASRQSSGISQADDRG